MDVSPGTTDTSDGAYVVQGLGKTVDRACVHVVMFAVATMHAHHRRFRAERRGICWLTAPRFGPISGQSFGMLGVIAVAERVRHHFIRETTHVPGMRQTQHAVYPAE